MNDAEALWRGKTDEEVADAARQLSDYTEEGERIIRGELRRRGMAEAPPTERPIDEWSSTVVNRDVDDTQLVVVGTFSNTIEAELAQGALQAADIASLVSADDAGGLRPSLWLSGVRLLVRAEDARQAQEILGSSK
jgi:hypothetical protein